MGSKKITIGYRYFMGIHFGITYGAGAKIKGIYAGGRVAWRAGDELIPLSGLYDMRGYSLEGRLKWPNHNGQINTPIDKNTVARLGRAQMFGGDKKEGGLLSDIDFMFGGDIDIDGLPGPVKQTGNNYMTANAGYAVDVADYWDGTPLEHLKPEVEPKPRYQASRGLLTCVFEHAYVSAITPYIKPIQFLVERVWDGWRPDLSIIGNGHANPAHIIYECIINKQWGMGYPSTIIDNENFEEVAQTLFDEDFGLSIVWRRETSVQDFMQSISDVIGGNIGLDLVSGLFRIDLVRDDYVVDDLFEVTGDMLLDDPQFVSPSISETVNAINFVYAREADDEKVSFRIENLANIEKQNGEVVLQTLEYLSIPTADLAARIAARELKTRSSQLAQVELACNRKAWNIRPAQAIKWSDDSLGIKDMVLRVVNVNRESSSQGRILIECIQDVFSLPTATYVDSPDSGWEPPLQYPEVIEEMRVEELPYWYLSKNLDGDLFAQLIESSSWVSVMAKANSGLDSYCSLYSGPASGEEENPDDESQIDHTPYCLLSRRISRGQTNLTFKSNAGVVEDEIAVPTLAFIGSELIGITGINDDQITCVRGSADTIPQEHPEDSEIFILSGDGSIDEERRTSGETIWYKPVNFNGLGAADFDSSPSEAITCVARQHKPYCPGRIQINNNFWPNKVFDDIVISWVNRDRDGIDQPADWFGETSELETDTTVTVIIRDSDNNILHQEDGITGQSFTYLMTDEISAHNQLHSRLSVEVYSDRLGVQSFQSFVHTFNRETTAPSFDLTDSPSTGWDLISPVIS